MGIFIRNIKHVFIEAAVLFIAVFFIFTGNSFATLSSSENYKLYTAMPDSGGASGSSSSYNSQNSIGAPLGTSVVTGTDYKIYAGLLSTMNSIPEVSISSHNDGDLIDDDTPTLTWEYVDKDEDAQVYYQIQISKDNFITTVADSGLVESNQSSFTAPILPTEESAISYRWRVRAHDGYDYSGWEIAASGFKLATGAMDAPVIWARVSPSGTDIPAKLWQGSATPYMYWEYPVTGAKIEGYSYAWGDIPDDTLDTQGVSYQTPDDILEDGVRVFNLMAANTAGGWSDMASFEIWIDRGVPVTGTYSPSDGAVISTDAPNISIGVSDDKSGVNPDDIDMTINKTDVGASYDKTAQRVVYIPSIPLSEGNNVVSFKVGDFVGNKTSSLVWSFIVDTKGPTGSIIINNQDAVTNSVFVDLIFSAADSTTEAVSMSISNDGVFDTESWENFSAKKSNWQLQAISGTRKVYVKFKDTAGNESQILNDTIELIMIAPDTIITSGPSLLTKSTKALFTFKSTVNNCVFRWKFDDEEWSDWTKNTSVSKDGLQEGNHYFKVQAARDVNDNGKIDPDEIDPVPEERTWTIGDGVVDPDVPKKRPFRFWKEE